MASQVLGMLTSSESCLTAAMAASAASSSLMPVVSTPMATATSARRLVTTGLLNSIAIGSSMAQATPCGVS